MLRLTVQLDQTGGLPKQNRIRAGSSTKPEEQTRDQLTDKAKMGGKTPFGGTPRPAPLVFLALHANMNAHENSLPRVLWYVFMGTDLISAVTGLHADKGRHFLCQHAWVVSPADPIYI